VEPLRPSPGADLVADLLDGLRVRSAIFCRSEMAAPWGFGVEAHRQPSFHVVSSGGAWLEVEGAPSQVRVDAGDLVVLPAGPRHWMRDAPGTPAPLLERILDDAPIGDDGRLHYGGHGPRTELVCGGFELDQGDVGPVVGALPAVIHVRGSDGSPAPWLAASLELVALVAESDVPGADAVLRRLADTMLLQALRSSLAALEKRNPARLAAMRDPHIAAAVRLMHLRPERRWTVADLAGEVAYSRSTFALRFRHAVGASPMRYLTHTRLNHAAALLVRTDAPLGEVSRRCGYANEFSFSRAFKRAFGVSPGAYRAAPAAASRDLAVTGA
jgi:AraC-like DNA-binding protein/mannose-6-phosphate isomerase-like protein (cupin superfamily)